MKTVFILTPDMMEIARGPLSIVVRGNMDRRCVIELADRYLERHDIEVIKQIYDTFGGLEGIRIERYDEDLSSLRFD